MGSSKQILQTGPSPLTASGLPHVVMTMPRSAIDWHVYSYAVVLTYLVIKTMIFDYDQVKLYPETRHERAEFNLTVKNGLTLEDLPKCDVNPWRLVSITGAINNSPDCWLWRLLVAYNSGFIFYQLPAVLKHGCGRESKAALVSCYSLQLAVFVLTYFLDMRKPLYLWRLSLDFSESPIRVLSWYLHILMTAVLGAIGMLMSWLIRNKLGLWMAVALTVTGLSLYFSSVLSGYGCFDYSYSAFTLVEYFGIAYLFWSYRLFLLHQVEAKAK